MSQPRKYGELRIIAGQWRGRKIQVIDQPGLRPTPDRVRETLFNWLQNKVVHAHCLDLFAGTGALGLEALSRGAAQVTFIDNNAEAIKRLKLILAEFKTADKATVLQQDVLQKLTPPAIPYDIIFLDPPFDLGYLQKITDILQQPNWLNAGAMIYIESEVNLKNLDLPANWEISKEKIAGNVCYRLIKLP